MDVNQKRAEAAMTCFELNTHLEKVHVTSDLKCFPKQNDAVNHARALTDTSIDVFDRDGDDDLDFNDEESEELTDEAETIPDHLIAQSAYQKNTGAEFAKVEKPEVDEPVETDTPEIPLSGDSVKKEVETPTPAAGANTTAQADEHSGGLMDQINHVVDEVEQGLGINDKAE